MSGPGDLGARQRALVPHHDALPVPAELGGARGDAETTPAQSAGPPPAPPKPRLLLWALCPVLLLILWGIWQHHRQNVRAAQAQRAEREFVPSVRTAMVQLNRKPVPLVLPGQTVAFDQARLFARATGYVAERRVDIGSRVRKGDLLIRIAAPDLDQQLAQTAAQLGQSQARLLQAQAMVEQAQANTKLANVTKFRTTTLAAQGWETRQNADQSTANASVQKSSVDAAEAGVKVAEADFKAQLATVQRLQALTAFERVTAPFEGVITARNVDVGDLVNADAASASPLFTVQNDNVLRISVQVPQSGAIGIHDGMAADITVPELPGRHFTGTVSRSAVALNPASRSLPTEVDVPNPDHMLRPGLYVNVLFHLPRAKPAVVVPSDALVFNADGMQVATVDNDGTVHLHPVSINRDFGQSVELNSGLQGGERIALGLPAGIGNGGKIRIQSQPAHVGRQTG